MKKILGIGALAGFFAFMCWTFSYAVDMDVWLSSNTATADATGVLCGQYVVGTSTVVYHGVLHAVIVSTPTAGGVTVYQSSSSTTAASIGPVNTSVTQSPIYYDVSFPNGMMYAKTGTAQVQILYQCY